MNNNFWDFVNEMNQQGRGSRGPPRGGYEQWDFNPWGFPFGHQGPLPHRGRHGPPHEPPHGPPHGPHGPYPPAGPDAPPPPREGPGGPHPPPPPPAGPPSRPGTPPTPPESVPEDHHRHSGRDRSPSPPGDHRDPLAGPPHDGRGSRGPGRHGHHGHGHGHVRGHGPGPRRGRGGRDRGGREFPSGARGPRHSQAFDWEDLPYWTAQLPQFLNGIFGPDGPLKRDGPSASRGEGSFSPEVDVFNAAEAYIIHVSVPGAKKGDMDVSYDANANAVKISGVVQRPSEVDEAMMNTLAESGRKVGLFERTVYLDKDTRVDADGLSAKLEDGVLRIEVPKLMDEDWTEVRKVQVD
ncbi:HSP20-like chaperone [Myriangium duriaei CBS 260.36]|uniref:HSP20-like chaperone n=1 Tax=Myriangium duriaei CBS 260.36 TaxID=1168546 RepID=A0A9P4MQ32_9PEZI|nr:HSP20-like chaperone [Myriangium duriaei CBS 260.36]